MERRFREESRGMGGRREEYQSQKTYHKTQAKHETPVLSGRDHNLQMNLEGMDVELQYVWRNAEAKEAREKTYEQCIPNEARKKPGMTSRRKELLSGRWHGKKTIKKGHAPNARTIPRRLYIYRSGSLDRKVSVLGLWKSVTDTAIDRGSGSSGGGWVDNKQGRATKMAVGCAVGSVSWLKLALDGEIECGGSGDEETMVKKERRVVSHVTVTITQGQTPFDSAIRTRCCPRNRVPIRQIAKLSNAQQPSN
ncbi:hypothetical protein B0H13DRAFT_1850820 [Mycena leptocephala]|nr:hypothetical protein B0H13DRAFT_1850820 [Mycena leptocephala]